MYYITIFTIGVLFSLGLGLSGMTNPEKVTGFLNVTGQHWDPGMGLVMLGAVTTFFVAQLMIVRRGVDIQGKPLDLPTFKTIDARLVGGAALFGVGWGLVGFCPGPALVAAASSDSHYIWIFIISMTAGMYIYMTLDTRFQERPDGGASLLHETMHASAKQPDIAADETTAKSI
jgi:uncharacterized membrane protein YedE/YeeE